MQYYDWFFCLDWGLFLLIVGGFLGLMILVVFWAIGGHKAKKKIKAQRVALRWKRMGFYHINELPETLPDEKGDDALTFEELYHFLSVVYKDSVKMYQKHVVALDQCLLDIRNLYNQFSDFKEESKKVFKKGTKKI